MRVFNLIWAGQGVSLIGTGMTTFGIGVWVFARTGSPTAFALLIMAGSLPGLLTLPFAGALVDRWDRRRVMLLSDLGTAVAPLAVVALNAAGALRLWHLYALVVIGSVFKAFQWPAFSSLVPQIVAKDDLGRANGRVGLAEAAASVFGELLGGGLYGVAGLNALLLADLGSFVLAVGTTLFSYRLLPAIPPARTAEADRGPLVTEMTEGWRFIRRRPGLFGLLLFFAANNLLMETALVLVSPLVLSGHAPSALGVVNAIGAVGMVVVSGVISLTRPPRRLVRAILTVATLHGCLLVVMGASHGALWLLSAGLFGILGGYAVTNAVTATLWQRKTPVEVQGRVFAVRRMIAWSADPVAFGIAGPVAQFVGAPLVTATAAHHITGSGAGAGTAMVFLIAGPLLLAVVAVTWLRPRVRRMEHELPDVDAEVAAPSAHPGGGNPEPEPELAPAGS
ncbi:MFS transporter [Streptomyces sp. 150FB]|uniref:MFS transporter n=1 Tax=Streptomyces sp. 150FB TaxID=1576605 RepID=UPI0006988A1C|nr:MFS transporter [Streptomyces sp. 150FB]